MTLIPVVIDALGTIPKGLLSGAGRIRNWRMS